MADESPDEAEYAQRAAWLRRILESEKHLIPNLVNNAIKRKMTKDPEAAVSYAISEAVRDELFKNDFEVSEYSALVDSKLEKMYQRSLELSQDNATSPSNDCRGR